MPETQLYELMLIAGMAVVTYLTRYPMLVIVGKVTLPLWIARALRYVPVAVLTAICVPAVLMPQGQVDVGIDNAYLFAGIFATVVAWRSKNLLLTIALGMAGFFLWRALTG